MRDFLCKASFEQPIWRDFQQVLLNPPSRIIHWTRTFDYAVRRRTMAVQKAHGITHDYAAAVFGSSSLSARRFPTNLLEPFLFVG